MKDLVVFDVETTGLDANRDWIIQLSAMKVEKESFIILSRFNQYVMPPEEFEMRSSAEAIHGISEEKIKTFGMPLESVARSFLAFSKDCDLCGYNSNSFDVKFLYNNFRKVGIELPMDRMFYDVYCIEAKLHSRKLQEVYKRYFGCSMEDSGLDVHDALGDTTATLRVLQKQIEENNLSFEELDTWSENQLASPEGSLKISQEGMLLFSIGKYRDNDIYEVMKKDPEYVRWWAQNVSSPYSKERARRYCKAKSKHNK